MSKSKRGRRGISNSTPTATTRVIGPTVRPSSPITQLTQQILTQPLSDRRIFNPTRSIAPPFALNRNATRIVVDKLGKSIRRQTKAPLAFNQPEQVAICVRRKQRKQVLHALRKTGKGQRRRNPRKNFWSRIKC